MHLGNAQTWIETFSYPAVMLLLVGAGTGLPISEDLVMLTGGVVVAHSRGNLGLMMAAAWVGVVTGDFILYSIGRRFGVRVIEHKWLRKALTRKRMNWVMSHFDRWGAATVFVVRFTSGFRIVTYLSAGMSRMSRWKFVLADAVAGLIFVPLLVWLGWRFGLRVLGTVEHAAGWVVLGVIVLLALASGRRVLRRRRRLRAGAAVLEQPDELERDLREHAQHTV